MKIKITEARLVIGAVFVTALFIFAPFVHFASAFSLFDKYETVSATDGQIVIPTDDVSDGKAHYYVYKDGGKEIRFFVIMDDTGVLRAAFDACDVCYPEKKGYDQNGEYMVCNNCGQHFHIKRINVVKGGCNPAPLQRDYDANSLRINVADVMAGTAYF